MAKDIALGQKLNDEMLFQFASVCKALGNSKRLRIIDTLKDSELAANDLSNILGLNKSHLFQHMSILVDSGMVKFRRAGGQVFYRLTDKKIIEALNILHQVFLKKLSDSKRLFDEAREYKL